MAPCRICRFRDSSGEDDGLCDICAHFHRIQARCKAAHYHHGTMLLRARRCRVWQMCSKLWLAATHLHEDTATAVAAVVAAHAVPHRHDLAMAAKARAGSRDVAKALVATQPSTLTWCAPPPRRPQMRPWWIALSAPSVFFNDFNVQGPPRQAAWHGSKKHCGTCTLFGMLAEPPKCLYLSVRVGEATNPGPLDDAASRRDRTLHALAQMALCHHAAPPVFRKGRCCRTHSGRTRHYYRLARIPPLRGLPSSRLRRWAKCFRQCPTTQRRATLRQISQMTAL